MHFETYLLVMILSAFLICKFRQIGEVHAVVLCEQADRFPADTVQADVKGSQTVNTE